MSLPVPKKILPNWALAGVLAGFVGRNRSADSRILAAMVKAQSSSQRRAVATASTARPQIQAKPARKPTVFEERLYQVCRLIPRGKVSTYGAMAKVLNSSPRAVGQALRRNPYAPEVPCHRVIAASLQLGGFQGTWGATEQVASKQRLLKEEGVGFQEGRLQSAQFVFDAEQLAQVLQAEK
ncbi:hypothetical protein WJX72_011259 [[Myrmecia] bisecta]|uniref:Methylated-DNA--protein-cysteine methyltransferase n=1 Tax=[Myrmecia] bisecta TaxID=41462 RepID=A0AAW1PPW0_9CHLO